ncbi:MAG: leucyl-tRNA synthetase [Patescibacteria group bacterium]|jgi:leucyl-tRNA synthetase
MDKIDFAVIEKKWQDKWAEAKLFEAEIDLEKEKFYMLEMFPYPSGDGLHMGHALNFTIGDICSRFKRLQGFNVLHPVGFDSFGLPAENAAIKNGVHPFNYTTNSIANFTQQSKALGISYDWSRVVNTADPSYSKWDQWIFLKFLEKGLAYQKETSVNWCDSCATVLANEQVENGCCWRHEDKPIKIKHLKQWFLKITDYADRLLEGHSKLDWPTQTIAMQKNWIGKSEGAEILFDVNGQSWPVFTTRPDTLFGVTFLVIAAGHSKLDDLVTEVQREEVTEFLSTVRSVSEKEMATMEKNGVFTGSYAINPMNNEKVPIYAGNFVLADYGSGMVMAVPAHDSRDFAFAQKYGLSIRAVIEGGNISKEAFTGSGKLLDSGDFTGAKNDDAKGLILERLEKEKKGKRVVNYKLRDWGISRQRYWGTPIPIVYCDSCGVVPVPESELPIELPREVTFGNGNPLESALEWKKVPCPSCKKEARRETDTMDTFVNSSWYQMRFADAKNDAEIFDSAKANYWCPVDQYVGGSEHACMHLLYSRFYTMFLHDIGLINFEEPFTKLLHQGFVQAEDGTKMSKSKGNVVNPNDIISAYGVDVTRYFLLSLAEPDKPRDWSEKGINGSTRFIRNIYSTFTTMKPGKTTPSFEAFLHKSIRDITMYVETFRYRMATIALKQLFEEMSKQTELNPSDIKSAIILLSPFCPHICEEMWEMMQEKGFCSSAAWPKFDESKLNAGKVTEDINSKTITRVKEIFLKVGVHKKVFLYVMPFELDKFDPEAIAAEVGAIVNIHAVNEDGKHDPEGKAKKAKPGMPSIYVE